MNNTSRDIAAKKITEMPVEQILKLLLFMASIDTQPTAKEADCQDWINAIRYLDKG